MLCHTHMFVDYFSIVFLPRACKFLHVATILEKHNYSCHPFILSVKLVYGKCRLANCSLCAPFYYFQPYHVSPSILNVLHNLYLRGNEGFANHSITVYNHPLPRRPMSTVGAVESDLLSFVVGAASILGSSFLLASFSTFIVQEKSSKVRQLLVCIITRRSHKCNIVTITHLSGIVFSLFAFTTYASIKQLIMHFQFSSQI